MNHRQDRNAEAGEAELPPHAPDTERAVLGCMLLAPQESIPLVLQALLPRGQQPPAPRLPKRYQDREVHEPSAEAVTGFYDLRHQTLFDTLVEMYREGKPVDLVTVAGRLKDAGLVEGVGGLGYLSTLPDAVPSAANLEAYLAELMAKASLRRIAQHAAQAAAQIKAGVVDVAAFVCEYQRGVLDIAEGGAVDARGMDRGAESIMRVVEIIEERCLHKTAVTGIPTPSYYLNSLTSGLHRQELTLVAARRGGGKTAWLLNVEQTAIEAGRRTCFVSLEMTRTQLHLRRMAMRARIDSRRRLRQGFLDEVTQERFAEAVRWLVDHRPFFADDDRPGRTGLDVLMQARREALGGRCDLLLLDYGQLMRGRARQDRLEALMEASASLLQAAKEGNIPVVCAVQLNRDAERERRGSAPLLSDIKDCGTFEQDAHNVWALWGPKLDPEDFDDWKWLRHHEPDDVFGDDLYLRRDVERVLAEPNGPSLPVYRGWQKHFRRVNLTVLKQREGPSGEDCELVMHLTSGRMVDAHSPNRGAPTGPQARARFAPPESLEG